MRFSMILNRAQEFIDEITVPESPRGRAPCARADHRVNKGDKDQREKKRDSGKPYSVETVYYYVVVSTLSLIITVVALVIARRA